MYDAFCEKFTAAVDHLHVGDPMNESTDIGPLAKASAVNDIDIQVQQSIQQWAVLLTGGKPWSAFGPNFYLPTVLKDVVPGMKVFDEEVFGPVAPISKAKDIEDVIRLTNNSIYGLWCSIFETINKKKNILPAT
jgi:acyl-CoA reductase-like NAD-dependent aldehyde dehydrogenase